MDLAILGPLVIRRDDGTGVALTAHKPRALLVRLLVDAGRVVPTDRLIDDLWRGAPPAGALVSLRAYVSNLRRALTDPATGRAPLVSGSGGYGLELAAGELDVDRFERDLQRARAAADDGRPDQVRAALDDALAHWRGDALADVADEPFAQATIARLAELRRTAEEERAEALVACGEHGRAIADLEAVVTSEPLRERPRRTLALALYRAGRTADALEVHRAFRDLLADELGLDPSPAFEDLVGAILRGDRTLDAPDAVAPSSAGSGPDAAPASATGDVGTDRRAGARGSEVLGRDRERTHLARAVADVRQGHGHVVLLGGEPGIGKTTLLEELARLTDVGTVTAWGRCPEVRGAPAFWPWRQALRTVVGQLSDVELRAVIDADSAAVGHLVPDVVSRSAVAPPPAGDDPAAARFALYDAVVVLLRRVSRSTPLVLLLDDLHWADEASLELLAYVGAELERNAVLVAATYRDAPADRPAALDVALSTLARLPAVAHLHLDGLSAEHVRELVAREVDGAPAESTVGLVADRTAGNPFFVRQLASLLSEAAQDEAAPTTVPTGVRHVIARRLQRLSDGTQTVLETAATVGRDFDVEVVAVASDTSPDAVLAALGEASDHGLVTTDRPGDADRAGARHRFVHALVRETLHDGLSPARAARVHTAVGAALESTGAAPAAELAEHFWAGVTSVGDERPVRYAIRAADEAFASLAYEGAEAQLRRALTWLERRTADVELELAVRTRLVALLTSVHGWSTPDITSITGAVRDLTARVGLVPELLPLWHLRWTGLVTRGDARGGLALARELRTVASEAGDDLHLGMARSMVGYGEVQLGGDGDRWVPEIVAARELLDTRPEQELARTPEHLGVTVRLAETVSRALTGDATGAMEAGHAVVTYAGSLDRPFPSVAAEMFAAWAAAVVGDAELAHRWAGDGLARCERYGFRQATHLLTPVHAWAGVQAGGDPRAAAARIGDALVALRAAGHLHVLPQWLALLADVQLTDGEPEAASAALADARLVIEETHERVYERQLDALATRTARAGTSTDPAAVRPSG